MKTKSIKKTPATKLPNDLLKSANSARKHSHSPYSRYAVGAAVRVGSKVYTGCNIENASYGATVCAERVALWKAVSEGHRKIDEIAVVIDTPGRVIPCALCLQVMAEFCDPSMKILVGTPTTQQGTYRLKDLLPESFGARDLK